MENLQPDNTPPAMQVPATSRPWTKVIWSVVVVVALVGLYALWSFVTTVSVPETGLVTASTTPTPSTAPTSYFVGSTTAPIRLTYAVHWAEAFQVQGIYENGTLKYKGLQQYLEEYVTLHPDIAFQIQIIQYQDYEQKIKLLARADAAPDIFQIYAPWGVSYVQEGLLDPPPSDIQEDVRTSFVSTAGATIDGRLWGYPTEINTFALAYNKKLLAEAGITPPRTWAELLAAAKKLTKRDEGGRVTQYGIAFLRENDWQVVDPFLSLLFTNSGAYLSTDLKAPRFQEDAGVEALDSILTLFRDGSTDTNANFFEFKDGKVAMVITPPWPKAIFAGGFGDSFSRDVGVVPIPYLKKPATLQYSWFMGVMSQSAHRNEAWDFLQWFAGEQLSSSGSTRYGNLLAETIGAIPSRTSDIAAHSEQLNDSFTKAFVDALANSVPEPNVAQAGAIKKILMNHIQAAWDGKVTARQTLLNAAKEVQTLLDRNAAAEQ